MVVRLYPGFSPPKSLPKRKKTYKKRRFVGAVLPWSHPTRSRKNHRKITEPSASWWFFTNPSEKYAEVKLDHFPKDLGVKIPKIFELPPPSGNLGNLPVCFGGIRPPKKISGNLRELSRKIGGSIRAYQPLKFPLIRPATKKCGK